MSWECEKCGAGGDPIEGDCLDDYIDGTDQPTVAVELECPTCGYTQFIPLARAAEEGWVVPR